MIGCTPTPLKKHIKVTDDVYYELKRLTRELGVDSPNQVIRKLIEHYRKTKKAHTQHPEEVNKHGKG